MREIKAFFPPFLHLFHALCPLTASRSVSEHETVSDKVNFTSLILRITGENSRRTKQRLNEKSTQGLRVQRLRCFKTKSPNCQIHDAFKKE